MIAVFVNCFAVILGSFLGIMFSRKMNSELNITISDAAGVVTLVIGLQMALNYNNIIYVILSLIIGGILGNLANIDGKILQFGKFLEKHLYHKKLLFKIRKYNFQKLLQPN